MNKTLLHLYLHTRLSLLCVANCVDKAVSYSVSKMDCINKEIFPHMSKNKQIDCNFEF